MKTGLEQFLDSFFRLVLFLSVFKKVLLQGLDFKQIILMLNSQFPHPHLIYDYQQQYDTECNPDEAFLLRSLLQNIHLKLMFLVCEQQILGEKFILVSFKHRGVVLV